MAKKVNNMMHTSGAGDLLHQLFRAAVAAVDPLHAIGPHLPAAPKGRTIVIGAGKAAARMAQGVEQYWHR
jgi:glycerate 2-kinase